MFEIFGVPAAMIVSQISLGLVNGSFYAVLSLGLSLIFGMLHIVNFAHGVFFMLGAMGTWILQQYLGIGYWPALVIIPAILFTAGYGIEKGLISRLYQLDVLYGLLFTFGMALFIEGAMREIYGTVAVRYGVPDLLRGVLNVGALIIPYYRIWVLVIAVLVCGAVWLLIDRTQIGAQMRAATENPGLVRSFGIRVPRLLSWTYASGVALAGFAGVLAAPVFSVSPTMGNSLLITVFAVVVIGGMGSIAGSIVTAISLGVVEAITKAFYPQGGAVVIFVFMVLVLMIRPAGLFGQQR